MLQFDIDRAKEVYLCDEDQYNEESLLNTLQDCLEYLVFHNKNLTTKQYHLVRDCWELACCIERIEDEGKENENV